MSTGYVKPGSKAIGGRRKIGHGKVEEVTVGATRGSGNQIASRGGRKSGVRTARK